MYWATVSAVSGLLSYLQLHCLSCLVFLKRHLLANRRQICCKAHARINRKIENSTLCKIATHKNSVQKFAHVIASETATTVQISVCQWDYTLQIGEI